MLKQEPQFSHIRITARLAWQRHLLKVAATGTPEAIGAAILGVPAQYSGVSVSEALAFVRGLSGAIREVPDEG